MLFEHTHIKETSMTTRSLLIIGTALLAFTNLSQAEVISIADPNYEITNGAEGILRPTRGMTMTQVKQQYGEPQVSRPAIGQPPITRWQYEKFEVVFEYDKVIHSVVVREDR